MFMYLKDYAVVIEKEIKTSTDKDDDKSPSSVKSPPISESDKGMCMSFGIFYLYLYELKTP